MISGILFVFLFLFLAAGVALCFLDGLWLTAAVLCAAALCAGVALAIQHRQGRKRLANLQDLQDELKGLTACCEEQKAQAEKEKAQMQEGLVAYKHQIAHNLRMPVSIIQGYADILLGDLVKEEVVKHEYLQKISERSVELTHALHEAIGQSEQGGKDSLVHLPFDMLRLLSETAEDMAIPASQKGIDIRLITQIDALLYDGDEAGIRRALYNIFENSVKYMGRSGAVNITVTADDSDMTIVIKDDGFGLEEEEVENIFQKGYQGSNSHMGSGTGLHLTKNIVENHGGTISAHSGLGRGLGLTIKLPLFR